MKLLCLSRKHPPSVGGMQRMNYEVIRRLADETDTVVIAWGRSQAYLPFFLAYALFRSLLMLRARRRPDCIYLGDALLAPLGLLLKRLLRRPAVITVHGKDLVFSFPFYQTLIAFCLRRLDRVIAVSSHTARLCLQAGIPAERCVTIPNGIDPDSSVAHAPELLAASEWLQGHGIAGGAVPPMLISVGRLVRRKGIAEFVRQVMPSLTAEVPGIIHVIVGEGKERKEILHEIRTCGLAPHVLLAGFLPDKTVKGLLGMAKLFIMPNIRVPGDVEGFGLVALEAASARLPVLASDLEGIRDAIFHGENGFLLPPDKPGEWVAGIMELLSNEGKRKEFGEKARRFTIEHYSWDRCATCYLEELIRTTRSYGGE